MNNRKALPSLVILTIWLGWICLYSATMILTPLLPIIETEFRLSHVLAGLLVSAYMLPYSLMQILSGYLSDRSGIRKPFFILAVFGVSISTMLTWLAKDLYTILVLRFLVGLFGGMFYAPSTAFVTQSSGDQDKGKALGIIFTSFPVANIIISSILGLLVVEKVGWRNLVLIFGLPGILYAPFMFVLSKKQGGTPTQKGVEGEDPFPTFWKTLKSPPILLSMMINFTASLASWSLLTFLPTYFVLVRKLSISETSILLFAYWVVQVFSSPIAGYVTGRIGPKLPTLASLLATCIAVYTIPIVPIGILMIVALIIWGLLGNVSFTAFNIFLTETVPTRLHGTFFGVFNFMGFFAATIGPIVLGNITDTFGFDMFFTVSLAFYIISALFVVIIKEDAKNPKR